MRVRSLLILTTMMLGVMLLGGVVLAVTRPCTTDLCRGTNGPDSLTGDAKANQIYGLGGDDYVAGGRGQDYLSGGRGVDQVAGRAGYDRILGAERNIRRPYSHKVHYQVQGGRGTERLLGGGGNDIIKARDGREDIILGGPGRDKAYVDRVDNVKGVENEVVPGGGGTGGGPPQPKQCADGLDNDNDGKTDSQDPGCNSPPDDTESPDPIVHPQCDDGKDNDNDGKIDFGTGANNDPGCDSLTDDTENTPPKNTPPVANDDTYSVPSCSSSQKGILNVDAPGVLDNDSDADGNTLSASVDSPPTQSGHLTLNADGSFTYEIPDGCTSPSTTFGGDSFTYKATDSAGDSDVAKVSLTP